MRLRSALSSVVSVLVAFAAFGAPRSALAQDLEPLPKTAPVKAPMVVTPAPGQAAASAPSPRGTPITATCTLGDHHGIDDDEAYTAADVLCHELARQGATNTEHEVRFGKLGGKTLVIIASRNGNAYDERRSMLNGMDELPTAAPRLVGALSEGKELSETRTVDNVLASETRTPKVQRGQMGFEGGIYGTTALGASAGSAGGIALGLLYRAGSWGLGSSGRAGGIGSSDNTLANVSLDFGVRRYLSDGDVAPFVGGGLGLSYFNLNRERANDLDGSGFSAYLHGGVETFRSHHAALSLGVRVDVPFYALSGTSYAPPPYDYTTGRYSGSYASTSRTMYVVPVSLNVMMVFH